MKKFILKSQNIKSSLHWARKKTIILIAGVFIIAAGSFYFSRQGSVKKTGTQASYVRTTILKRTTLNNSISVSGTVESAAVSNVTTNQSLTVKSIPVQVGDWVQAGDVICVLDSVEIDKSITRAQEKLQESIETAQEALNTAEQNYTWAKSDAETAWNTKTEKEQAMNAAKSALDSAQSSIDAFQAKADQAQAAYQSAVQAENQALNDWNSAIADGTCAASGCDAENAYNQAKTNSEQARTDSSAAEQELKTVQSAMNYDSLSAYYNAALSAYEQAEKAWNTARDYRDTCESRVSDAKETLTKNASSDELEDLQEKLAQCTLTAETAGKVTAINVTVGSMAGNNTTIATIQDTESLKVAVTIPEYDIQNVEAGMRAVITSDATEDEIEGTLTQISPVASSGNSTGFSAEITVNTQDSGLYVGINANAEIIQSTVDNVFVVPIDAVGTNEAGSQVVFVRESGSGADGVFRAVEVTTGAENDYYIEIRSDELSEDMEICSSADPEQAKVSSTGNDSEMQFPSIGGADIEFSMPEGGSMPSSGPSGNGGGGMPGGRGGN